MSRYELEVTPEGERNIVMTRRFAAPKDLVFDAFTRPEIVRRWLTGPEGWSFKECEIEARAGGKIRYVWVNQSGQEMGMSGTFREVAPPDRTVHTELFDEDWTGGETLVTTRFEESNGTTTVTMTVEYPSLAVRDNVVQSGMASGGAVSFDRLDSLLAA